MNGILTINNKSIQITDVTVRPVYDTVSIQSILDPPIYGYGDKRICTGFALSGQVDGFDPSTDLTLGVLECEEFKGEVYVSQCTTPADKNKKCTLRINSYGEPEKHPEIQHPASYR